jgi:hypothetical protein
MNNIKQCTACKRDKPLEEFGNFHGRPNKQCKVCREYHNKRWNLNTNKEKYKRKEYYQMNKEKHHLRNFKNAILKKYGLSVEEYNIMLSNQKNRCAICGTEFILDRSKSNLQLLPCVDHSHQTNKVRGLLCRMCNVFLGHIEIGLYDKAINYLRVSEMKDKEPS